MGRLLINGTTLDSMTSDGPPRRVWPRVRTILRNEWKAFAVEEGSAGQSMVFDQRTPFEWSQKAAVSVTQVHIESLVRAIKQSNGYCIAINTQ
jgi:hypothetical protein